MKIVAISLMFQLFARITKLGWFDVIKDEYVFKNVVNDVGQFIQVLYRLLIYLKDCDS